jgi:hypothetical protein
MQKNVFIVSMVIMIVSLICLIINGGLAIFSDNAIRVLGAIMLVDVFALSYSTMRLSRDGR